MLFASGLSAGFCEFVFCHCVLLEALCRSLSLSHVCVCVVSASVFSWRAGTFCSAIPLGSVILARNSPATLCSRSNWTMPVVETGQSPSLPNQHTGRSTGLSKYTIQPLVETRRRVERLPEALGVHGQMQQYVRFLDPRNSCGLAQAQETERRVHQCLSLHRRETFTSLMNVTASAHNTVEVPA